MPITLLKSNQYWAVPFTIPQNKTVRIDVEAGGKVDMHIFLNDYELNEYKAGRFPYSTSNRTVYGIEKLDNKINLSLLSPPLQPMGALQQKGTNPFLSSLLGTSLIPNSIWYLVFVNRGTDIPIFCRVYNA